MDSFCNKHFVVERSLLHFLLLSLGFHESCRISQSLRGYIFNSEGIKVSESCFIFLSGSLF